jgi:hypothetical protein
MVASPFFQLECMVFFSFKRLLLGSVMLLMLLPAFQAKLRWVPVEPLDGYFDPVPRAEYSWSGLRDNSFQNQLEAYLQDRLGFRTWLLRMRNQLAYSVFRMSRVNTVVVGKDDVLFQPYSIDALLGKYASPREMVNRVKRLKLVQDSLRAHGTQFLLVAAPGKARIMPELLPAQFANQPRSISNYDAVMMAAHRYGLNVLDGAALLKSWQDTSRFPMFPRGGTHWSGYATSLIADTLFRRIEHLTKHDLTDFASHGYTVATSIDSVRYTDDDIQKVMNRIWESTPYPLAYPRVVFSPETGKQRVNALVIGDSFAQSFYNFYPYFQHLFTPESRYWASYEYVFWPESAPESHTVHDLNLREQLAHRDIVLIIITEQNLSHLGYGFTDEAYNVFRPKTAADYAAIDRRAKELENNASWEEVHNDDRFAQHMHERAESEYDHTHE